MASKKLITGELEFSPERIEADALNFVGSCLCLLTVLHTHRDMIGLCCWRHPEGTVNKREMFLLPTPWLKLPLSCYLQRYCQVIGCLGLFWGGGCSSSEKHKRGW